MKCVDDYIEKKKEHCTLPRLKIYIYDDTLTITLKKKQEITKLHVFPTELKPKIAVYPRL